MKRKAIIVVMLTALTMSSCLVSSLHPFFKAQDIEFDEQLIGKWIDSDESYWLIEENKMSTTFMGKEYVDSTYRISYYEDEGKLSLLQGTLFVLDGKKYVDFRPHPNEEHHTSDMTAWHHIPVHTLAKLITSADSIMFFWYGEEWLNDLFEEKRIRIKNEKVDYLHRESYLLTAETDDLQKFIRKYMANKELEQDIDNAFSNNKDSDDHAFLKLYPYKGEIPHRNEK